MNPSNASRTAALFTSVLVTFTGLHVIVHESRSPAAPAPLVVAQAAASSAVVLRMAGTVR